MFTEINHFGMDHGDNGTCNDVDSVLPIYDKMVVGV